MSTRELAHTMIDQLSEEQLQALIILLNHNATVSEKPTPASVRGIFSDCANAEYAVTEKDAWRKAAVEKYENT